MLRDPIVATGCRRASNTAPAIEAKSAPPVRPGDDRLSSHARPVTGRDRRAPGVWSVLEWAQVRARAPDDVSQREIAKRLGINRRTVCACLSRTSRPGVSVGRRGRCSTRLSCASPCGRDQGPWGHGDVARRLRRRRFGHLVRRRLPRLHTPREHPARPTGYRPGRRCSSTGRTCRRGRVPGRERHVYARVGSLPFSGAQSAHFSFDNARVVLGGHVRLFDWLGGWCESVSTTTCARLWPDASARRVLESMLSAPARRRRLYQRPPDRDAHARRGRSRARCAT